MIKIEKNHQFLNRDRGSDSTCWPAVSRLFCLAASSSIFVGK
ncbi:hypothetical protein BWK52_0285 [Lacticaseibacillus paracasei]|nr:hypothetical protein BWK52_0285 [Lacticaseibacillus paracasei]